MNHVTTAPAFQIYASNLIVDRNFKKMSHMARSLWLAMTFELWFNDDIPKDPYEIAKIIHGFTEIEVAEYLPEVMWHFEIKGDCIVCATLQAQKKNKKLISEKKAIAGRKGGLAKKENANDYEVYKNGER